MLTDLSTMLIMLPIFVVSISLHEYGHALAGYLCGDDTAERAGRLTVNPLAHLDPIGTLMIALVGFGWAKPVPYDPRNLKNPRLQQPLIAAAGPLVNLLLMIVALIGYRISGPYSPFAQTWQVAIILNAMLVVFNMLPIPPLDGSVILREVMPRTMRAAYDSFATYGWIALLLFIYLPVTRGMLTTTYMALVNGINRLLPF